MSRLLERKSIDVNSGVSRLSFGQNHSMGRDLLLDGKTAYKLPVGCNTCPFFFEREDGANSKVEVDSLVGELYKGVRSLDNDLVVGLSSALPHDTYFALLAEFVPNSVEPWAKEDYFLCESRDLFGIESFTDLPIFTRTKYHRLLSSCIGDTGLFEFLVPMMPSNWLDAARIAHYRELIAAGKKPTCFCISLLDWRSPAATWGASEHPKFNTHACLAHFVLDGHHKLEAATQLSMPISMVSFLACGLSGATLAEIDLTLNHLV